MSDHLLACLLAWRSFTENQFRVNDLTRCESMEAYLSKIKNIHIVYTETFGEPDVNDSIYKWATQQIERVLAKKNLDNSVGRMALEKKRPREVRDQPPV